jgi:hypothetical protein
MDRTFTIQQSSIHILHFWLLQFNSNFLEDQILHIVMELCEVLIALL